MHCIILTAIMNPYIMYMNSLVFILAEVTLSSVVVVLVLTSMESSFRSTAKGVITV